MIKLTTGELQILNGTRLNLIQIYEKIASKKQHRLFQSIDIIKMTFFEQTGCFPPDETLNTSDLRKYIKENKFKWR